MQLEEAGQRHRAQLDHVHGFVKRCLLRGGGLVAERGEVEVLARGQDVVADQPVGGHDLVEPCEPSLVGVAAVAVLLKDVLDFGRCLQFGCRGLGGDAGTYQLQCCDDNRACDD